MINDIRLTIYEVNKSQIGYRISSIVNQIGLIPHKSAHANHAYGNDYQNQ